MNSLLKILILLMFLPFSCKNSEEINVQGPPYIINIEKGLENAEPMPLSVLGNNIDYLPLETNPDCILESIYKVEIMDSLIFVWDSNQLAVFDTTGKYLWNIGKIGRGPGEFTYSYDFIVDKKEREIFILSSKKVYVYDLYGEFKRDFTLDFYCSEFIMDEKGDLIFYRISDAQPTDEPVYSWYFYDKSGYEKKKIENTLKRVNHGISMGYSPLYLYEGSPHFMEFGIDTLYSYQDNTKIPYAIFDLGKLKYPVDPSLTESIQIRDKVVFYKIKETKELMLIDLLWGFDSTLNCVYNKTTADFTLIDGNGFVNDIDNGVNFWPQKIVSNDFMIGYIDALDFIAFAENNKTNNTGSRFNKVADQLTISSNPILVVLKNRYLNFNSF